MRLNNVLARLSVRCAGRQNRLRPVQPRRLKEWAQAGEHKAALARELGIGPQIHYSSLRSN